MLVQLIIRDVLEGMADSYANAFQVHQKPCKTAYIHKFWIRKMVRV